METGNRVYECVLHFITNISFNSIFVMTLCGLLTSLIHYQGSVQAQNLRDALAEAMSAIKVKATNYLHLTLIYRTFTCLGSYMVTLYDIGRSREGFLLFC